MKKILFAFLILIICVSCASAERKINKQPSNKDIIHLSDDLKIERIKKILVKNIFVGFVWVGSNFSALFFYNQKHCFTYCNLSLKNYIHL